MVGSENRFGYEEVLRVSVLLESEKLTEIFKPGDGWKGTSLGHVSPEASEEASLTSPTPWEPFTEST